MPTHKQTTVVTSACKTCKIDELFYIFYITIDLLPQPDCTPINAKSAFDPDHLVRQPISISGMAPNCFNNSYWSSPLNSDSSAFPSSPLDTSQLGPSSNDACHTPAHLPLLCYSYVTICISCTEATSWPAQVELLLTLLPKIFSVCTHTMASVTLIYCLEH